MGFLELFLLAIGLSADAFAVAICIGLSMMKTNIKKALAVGLYFGTFQAVMPLLGYLAATLFAESFIAYSHWIAFALLVFLGLKMALDSFRSNGDLNKEYCLKPSKMLPLALATSIDALAVGVSLALLQVSIMPAVSLIGITTFVISMGGVKIGSIFGLKFKAKAQLVGGIILILMGLRILL